MDQPNASRGVVRLISSDVLAWPLEVITIYEVNLSVCRKVLEISDEGASERSENL